MNTMTEAVRRHLKITWESYDTTAEVDDVMDRAAVMLGDLLGTELDLTGSVSGRVRDLFLNLCLYLYNGLTETEFIEAYREPLLIARQRFVDPINIDAEDDDEDS